MMIMVKNKTVQESENESEDQSSNGSEDESPNDEIEDGDSGEADDEDHSTGENENPNKHCNAGWVDSISKILKANKPKGKKNIALSKAKKLSDVKKNLSKPAGFEVETIDGEVKEQIIDQGENEIKSQEGPPRKKKRELPNLRVKPNILEKDRERILQKIATKGVVQLFNSVRMQQKDIDKKLKEAGPLEVRKEKVLKNIDKRAFLDALMGEKSQKVETDILKVKNKVTNNDPTWSVLKEDFMMGAKMKDWDKNLESEELEEELNIESD